jgi:hypothetical protein
MRFFEQESAGQEIGKIRSETGLLWAAKTLRNDDMDLFMFRLMSEYAPH